MRRMTIDHLTVYRYRVPVRFGEHRMMLRPRDSHDIRLVESRLEIEPEAELRWLHDVFGNSIAVATFDGAADRLSIQSTIAVENYGVGEQEIPILDYAQRLPFTYDAGEMSDLARTNERHYSDPAHRVNEWARRFLSDAGAGDTQSTLSAMTEALHRDFIYVTRYEEGARHPVDTLAQASGSCRDLALLMMEAARSLGLAARFVSGYLYDGALDSQTGGVLGGGATHAWVQIYLPGAGWLEFDPTNGPGGGRNLIRVAVARDPSQAVPIQGTYTGQAEDCIGMDVTVSVRVD